MENKNKLTQEDVDSNINWMEEVQEQDFDDDVFGACSTNTFSLSDYWGNRGAWCTVTNECMSWCR